MAITICKIYSEIVSWIQHLSTLGVSETLSMLEDVNSDFLSGEIPGRFEWIDSVLVTALRRGHWLLISHANFCRCNYV